MELLIKYTDPGRGMIIFCNENGTTWSGLECLDKFIVVQVDSITKAEARAEGVYFDLNDAFTASEIEEIKQSNWSVKTKSKSFIKAIE